MGRDGGGEGRGQADAGAGVVAWPTFQSSMSSLNVFTHGAIDTRYCRSVVALTSQVEMCP